MGVLGGGKITGGRLQNEWIHAMIFVCSRPLGHDPPPSIMIMLPTLFLCSVLLFVCRSTGAGVRGSHKPEETEALVPKGA